MGHVDHLAKGYRGTALLHRIDGPLHHQRPVGQGEINTILHLREVELAHLRRHVQPGELPLRGNLHTATPVALFCQPVVVTGHLIADIATAGMDHQPDVSLLVLLDLDEVIAAAQGPHLVTGRFIFPAHHWQVTQCPSSRRFRHTGR